MAYLEEIIGLFAYSLWARIAQQAHSRVHTASHREPHCNRIDTRREAATGFYINEAPDVLRLYTDQKQ